MRNSLLILLLIALTACAAPTPATAPHKTPSALLTFTESPTATASLPAGTVEPPPIEGAPATAEPVITVPVTMSELGISDPALTIAFKGIEKLVTPENGKFAVTIDGEKYILDGGWNLNVEQIKTVNAVDQQGNHITLIWNKEGLSVNSPLSTDIENPTDISEANILTMSQRFKLQNPDPFTKRTRDLTIRYELTENGRATFLRVDGQEESNLKPSNVWLRYKDSNGKIFLVNPMDLNDIDTRKVIMCTYGNASTEKAVLEQFIQYLRETKVIWPILKADESFFKAFQHISSPVPKTDSSELFDLLNHSGNKPENITFLKRQLNRDDVIPFLNVPGDSIGISLAGDGNKSLLDPAIEEIIMPCQIR